jgi:hypothetical protein
MRRALEGAREEYYKYSELRLAKIWSESAPEGRKGESARTVKTLLWYSFSEQPTLQERAGNRRG